MKNLSQISDNKDIITKEYLVAGYEPLLPATERTNLTAITALSTNGFIKRTDSGTYEIDSSVYSLSTHNHNGTYQPSVYKGTTATAIGTAAKVVTISGYTASIGNIIALTLTSGNSIAAMTLNINSLGAIAVRMNNIATNTTFATLAAGAVILLYYDGTYFQMLGSQRTSDSDTFDRIYWGVACTAGAAIYDYKLVMQALDGKFYPLTLENGTGTTKTVSTQPFPLNSPILYYASTTDVALNGSFSNLYSEYPVNANISYTTNGTTFTSQKALYLKGSLNIDGLFVLDNTSYTSWYTQTLPITNDGFLYILIGYMYSTTGFMLTEQHPIYEYKDNKLRQYVPEHVHTGVYQPIDADLTAIAGLTGTTGLLRKTAADTWSLDEPVQIKRW